MSNQELKANLETIKLEMGSKDFNIIYEIANKIASLNDNKESFTEIMTWFENFEEDSFVISIKAIFFQKIDQLEVAKIVALEGQEKDDSFPYWSDIIQGIIMDEFEKEFFPSKTKAH